MASIFVANGTMQHQQLEYRLPKRPGEQVNPLRRVMVRAGSQEILPADGYEDETRLQFVLDQLQNQYGAMPSNDPKAITRPLSLIYTVVRTTVLDPKKAAIKTNAIDAARERDIEARQTRSTEILESTGLAHFERTANLSGVRETSLEVVELQDRADEREKKGGVDLEVTVSKKARSKEHREAGNSRRR